MRYLTIILPHYFFGLIMYAQINAGSDITICNLQDVQLTADFSKLDWN